MQLVKGLASLGVLAIASALVVTFLAVLSYTAPDPMPEADAIIAISGPGPETGIRTAKAVELYLAGRAPVLVLSGGTGAAADMKAQAIAGGVPEAAIRIEDASRSTLQNAVFVRDLGVDPDAAILLVTHRYHLPRAGASFRWAGFDDVTAVAADADTPLTITQDLLMESVKWPVNILRAAFATTMIALDVPRERWIEWLN